MLSPIDADKPARGRHETVHFQSRHRDLRGVRLDSRGLWLSNLAYCWLLIFRETGTH